MKPPRVQFTLGRLMIAVAAAGIGLSLLIRVEGSFALALIGLAVLLVMMGGACAFAGIGVLFARLSVPTAHPLSDDAVGFTDRRAVPDPGITFEPEAPPLAPGGQLTRDHPFAL